MSPQLFGQDFFRAFWPKTKSGVQLFLCAYRRPHSQAAEVHTTLQKTHQMDLDWRPYTHPTAAASPPMDLDDDEPPMFAWQIHASYTPLAALIAPAEHSVHAHACVTSTQSLKDDDTLQPPVIPVEKEVVKEEEEEEEKDDDTTTVSPITAQPVVLEPPPDPHGQLMTLVQGPSANQIKVPPSLPSPSAAAD